MNQAQNEQSARQTLPWGWIGFFSTVILLALVSSFALISVGNQFAATEIPEHSLLRVIVDGKIYHVPEHARAEVVSGTSRIIQEQQARVSQGMNQQIDHLLVEVFAPVHKKIPEFADWYYSLTAEYLLYASAIGGNTVGFLQEQLLQRVFRPARLERSIDELPASVNNSLQQLLAESRQVVVGQLQSVAAAHSIQEQPAVGDIAGQLDLDPLLDMQPELNQKLINRQLISVVAATGTGVTVAKGLGALMVKKTLTKITAGKSFLAAGSLLGKLAGKSALKSGGTLGAAATGMVVCSPTGPGALLCGAVAGLATWIAVDAAVINLDEMLNREAFEAELHHVVREQQEKLSQAYSETYSALLSSHFSRLHQDGRPPLKPPATFIPAQTTVR